MLGVVIFHLTGNSTPSQQLSLRNQFTRGLQWIPSVGKSEFVIVFSNVCIHRKMDHPIERTGTSPGRLHIKSFLIKLFQCISSTRKSQFATWLSIVWAVYCVPTWEVTNFEGGNNNLAARNFSDFIGKIQHWVTVAPNSLHQTYNFYLLQCHFKWFCLLSFHQYTSW